MNVPSANNGREYFCCSGVPYRTSNSPGPKELGTATVDAKSEEAVPSFTNTADVAAVLKPLPPHSFGILRAKKPCRRMNRQTSSLKSLSSKTLKSSTRAQSSSVSLSKKLFSSSVSVTSGAYVFNKFSREGFPEKISLSNPTVPQPSATRSVSLILGIIFLAASYAARATKVLRETAGRAAAGAFCRVWRRMAWLFSLFGGAELPQKLATGSALAWLRRCAVRRERRCCEVAPALRETWCCVLACARRHV